MKKHLKILSVLGIALSLIDMFVSDNPIEYSGEMLGIIVLAAYSWEIMKDRIVMLWITGLFTLWYLFMLFSGLDLLYWAVAFMLVYKDTEGNYALK